MALSGSVNTNKYYTSSSGSIGLNLSWSAVQSIETNSTTISWTLKTNGTMSSGYSVKGGPIGVYIGGIRVFYEGGRVTVKGGGAYKKTGEVTIYHDEDGTKTIEIYVSGALYSSSTNVTGSAIYELDPITRFAYVTSVNDFTDESNPVMNYANPLGDVLSSTQACISLTDSGVDPAIAYRDIEINGSSYTFTLTESERNILRAACPNSDTLDVYFIIKSVMNGDTFYSKKVATMTVVNDSPTVVNAQYYDTNASTIAVTGDPTKIVQALSTVEFKFGTLTALKYSTLVSLSITINGVTESVSLSGTTQSNITKLFGSLNVSSNLPATVDIEDSRGNHTTFDMTISIYAWSIPTGAISLGRINNFETDCIIKVQASYSSIAGTNSVTITYQTKKTSDADYGAEVTIQDNTSYVIQLDNTYEWDVKVKITDTIGGTSTYNLKVGKGIPNAFWDRILRSYSLNCFPTHANSLEVNGNMYATDVVPTNKPSARANLGLGITELYNGSMSSGSETFTDAGYTMLIVFGKVTSSGSHNTINIPMMFLSASNAQFCISDETNYITFSFKIENGDITLTWGSRSSSGYVERVYGVI